MRLKHNEGWNVPADSPFYPPLPAHYRNVRFQFVHFRADPEAVAQLLPEPLEASADGFCVAGGLEVPFCSNYGPFNESFVVERCTFKGQKGYYCSHVFHTGPAGIAAGREVYGTPKVFADVSVEQQGRAMVTRTLLAGMPVLTISSTMEERAAPEEMAPLVPSWRLKIIPRADGPGPAVKQLIDGAKAAVDVETHVLMKGTGIVQFEGCPVCDLTGLQPIEYLAAFYTESSYSEGFAEVVYDYLR